MVERVNWVAINLSAPEKRKRWYWRTVGRITFKTHRYKSGSNNLKMSFMGVKFRQFLSKTGHKKNRRFVIFRAPFLSILTILGPIRIYRKTAPTKSTVLGPRPPPGIFINFMVFYRFFTFWGPSIEPEKPSVKSASTPYPPWKVIFMAFFNNSRPNLVP
jgi:hypothetical protein